LASGIAFEIREVKLSAKPLQMLAASPKGTVPVLLLPDGHVIDESIDIMGWALSQSDPFEWLCHDDAELIARNDGEFKHHLDRYKYPQRHASDAIEHRQEGGRFLTELDDRLSNRANLAADEPGLIDAALFPFVRQFAAADTEWFSAQPWSHLQRWLASHMNSSLFAQAMIRFKPWQTGDEPVFILRMD
jgi:glutathione S-transferase